MLKSFIILANILFMGCGLAYQPENKPDNQWSAIDQPTDDVSESIGSYANGCLRGGEALEQSSTGFIDMRRNRGRYYGKPLLISFIRDLGAFTNNRYSHKHLIGDLSQPRGGRMNFGHSSHQVGLDADIWMQTLPEEQAVSPYRDMKTIVDKAAGELLSGNMPAPTRDALQFSASHQDVARIFVNPVVKWHLCQTEKETAWLNKLRPWWGHDQHFHVRMNCPSSDSLCVNQNPPPPGDGCNSSLYNWVDEQSGLATGRIPSAKPSSSSKKRKPKVIPDACWSVLKSS